MARLALMSALLFTTVVGFIFLTGFSGEDKGILPPGSARGMNALSGEGAALFSEEGMRAIVAERFPEAGILETRLVSSGGFEARLLFGNVSYDVTLDSNGAIINIAVTDISTGVASVQGIESTATTPKTSVPKPRILNASAVALHNTASDCWLIINSKIYNVTSYLSEHPGGAASIVTYCGKEATTAFDSKGKTPPKPHSSFAAGLLDAYYVGFLGQVLDIVPTGASASVPTGTPSDIPLPEFALGDTVKTMDALNVRAGAGENQSILGKQEKNAQGVIAAGPVFVDGYWWWKIDYQSVPDGWSAGSFLALVSAASGEVAPIPATPSPATTPPSPTTTTGIATAEVAIHNTQSDCWVIFENKVYNVTSYISSHPGGASAITAYCGADLTAAFVAQGHSQNARSLFADYYVGDLAAIGGSGGGITSPPSSPPPTDSLQPYRDAIYAKYPGANITKLKIEDNGTAEFKFTYNGKTYEGKMNAQYQITKIE